MKTVEIDPHSGFCGGVIRAITGAEDFLSKHGKLYSLGDIVHNEAELTRLGAMGLVPLDIDDLDQISSAEGETILIRAHGQPPQVYEKLRRLGFGIIDCTCPMVLNLQQSIREAKNQIVILGKRGHPEVLGLEGQVTESRVHVVENAKELEFLLDSCEVDVDRPVDLFSQTTASPLEFEKLSKVLGDKMKAPFKIYNTICKQVASRHEEFEKFAREHDVIVFVSGRTSSNGKVLSDLCRSVNFRTFHIGGPQELQFHWFAENDRVGVCGATSTPRWLLEQVASKIEKF